MRFRGVVFDLWQTLVPFPVESAEEMYRAIARHFGSDPDVFRDTWLRGRRERELGPMEPHLRSLAEELAFEGDLAPVVTLGETGRSRRSSRG